jgi:imidazolonepropionase-like amidohydrolase
MTPARNLSSMNCSSLTRKAMLLAVALCVTSSTWAQVPADQLAKPPADAKVFSIVTNAGTNGKMVVWTAADGTQMTRESINLRGQLTEIDESVKMGADGTPSMLAVRGTVSGGNAAETFSMANGQATWKSQVDGGTKPYAAGAFYLPFGGASPENYGLLIEALLKAPGHELALLPAGRAKVEKLTTATVGHGATKKTVTAWTVSGLAPYTEAIWTTADGKFFATVNGLLLTTLPAGYEGERNNLVKAQDDALGAQSPALVKKLVKTPAGAVAFTHVRAFVDGTRFVEDQTVVVEKGIITKVGAAETTKVPAGAQVIDGKGKTLIPGLWDAHQHVEGDWSGPYLLALGITSARDPGNNDALTIARRERRAKGELLLPNVYPSALIDGKGPNSAQLGTVVTSEAEAIAVVDKAKAEGFTGVKIYGSFNPAWVAGTAAEAHKLGLHVHGHVPAGMRPSQAIAAGYDELTHIYFVSMEAMPDEVVAKSNGIARMQGTGKYAKDIDLTSDPMKSLVATMAAKKIASDPTIAGIEGMYRRQNGTLSPVYAPYVGVMPAVTERSFYHGGTPPKGVTAADYAASYAKEAELLQLMHRSGVPIVAGTDGSGIELDHELELYVELGFTPAEALATATIEPARLVHVEKTTGSIEVGKVSDVVLVEGDPSKRIGDVRNTRVVMMGGKLMDADELRKASGFSGRPKMVN